MKVGKVGLQNLSGLSVLFCGTYGLHPRGAHVSHFRGAQDSYSRGHRLTVSRGTGLTLSESSTHKVMATVARIELIQSMHHQIELSFATQTDLRFLEKEPGNLLFETALRTLDSRA